MLTQSFLIWKEAQVSLRNPNPALISAQCPSAIFKCMERDANSSGFPKIISLAILPKEAKAEQNEGNCAMTEHHFYGSTISRQQQEEVIEHALAKYKGLPATEDLRQKVYNDLMLLKHEGAVTIPFKVLLKVDENRNTRPHIEVILDTRV
ncbi:MAG: hypothetical protein KDK78_08090 [Chlamydiia bacterium]|nr:hypothetical protein [Chlamydiia bacterium]